MRRRFRIVGKQFNAAALQQAIESIDSSENPSNLKPDLAALLDLVQACLDKDGKLCPKLKTNGMWHLAHLLALDISEYCEKIAKLHEALELLVDRALTNGTTVKRISK
jgi:hypothetical protein